MASAPWSSGKSASHSWREVVDHVDDRRPVVGTGDRVPLQTADFDALEPGGRARSDWAELAQRALLLRRLAASSAVRGTVTGDTCTRGCPLAGPSARGEDGPVDGFVPGRPGDAVNLRGQVARDGRWRVFGAALPSRGNTAWNPTRGSAFSSAYNAHRLDTGPPSPGRWCDFRCRLLRRSTVGMALSDLKLAGACSIAAGILPALTL